MQKTADSIDIIINLKKFFLHGVLDLVVFFDLLVAPNP
jgi:hypothetical protein